MRGAPLSRSSRLKALGIARVSPVPQPHNGPRRPKRLPRAPQGSSFPPSLDGCPWRLSFWFHPVVLWREKLFSDRFFTSSFRPEFYSTLGVEWVSNNGPGPEMMEQGTPNGHAQPVSPLKRVLLRTMPELAGELQGVVNAFDPWARDRGEYYSLDWKARAGAEEDEAFAIKK